MKDRIKKHHLAIVLNSDGLHYGAYYTERSIGGQRRMILFYKAKTGYKTFNEAADDIEKRYPQLPKLPREQTITIRPEIEVYDSE